MPDQSLDVGEPVPGGAFGPNAWLVDDMYDQFRRDPESVSESWREFFADYVPGGHGGLAGAGNGAASSTQVNGAQAIGTAAPAAPPAAVQAGAIPRLDTAAGDQLQQAPEAPAPGPAAQPAAGSVQSTAGTGAPGTAAAATTAAIGDKPIVLSGASRRIAANMEASLTVPTATSVRTVPAKLLQVNRSLLNQHLTRSSGTKVSFTHIIGFAVVRALAAHPSLNSAYVADADGKGHPGVIRHEHVGLGLAVDVARPDGTRTLLVPVIREAERLDFRTFVLAYEELVRKVHAGTVSPDDFAGVTATLTNPGTLGTVQSVPRLMPGQGVDRRSRQHRHARGAPGGRSPRSRRDRGRTGRHGHVHLRPPHNPGR